MLIHKVIYSFGALLRLVIQLKNIPNFLNYFVGKPVQICLKSGLILNTKQPIDLITIKETVLDDEYQISALKRPLRSVIDVGAGLGDFSILTAKKFPRAKIVAFEPNKGEYDLFKENLRLNKVTNAKIYNRAVGRKKNYFLYLAASNIHGSTIKNYRAIKKVKVKGVRLDDFITEKVDLLKIDCEGAELDVLKSITPKKFALIRRIVAEYHNNIIHDEDKKITTILKKYHFKVSVEKNKIVPTTGYVFGESINTFAI